MEGPRLRVSGQSRCDQTPANLDHPKGGGNNMSLRIVVVTAAVSALALGAASVGTRAAANLDYEFFKAKVEPIFLMKRPGHSPCVVCHADANNQLHLEKLPEGQSSWTDEQSHKNFDVVSKMINAVDDPLTAKILLHPLAPEAGGDAFHSGGRQFKDRNDPQWKVIAAFAKGATLEPGKEKPAAKEKTAKGKK
jgi:hypothetical protein